ncbi:MAG: Glycyl-tRNA synthetase [Candidatus Shapirobacteria bacterium GW2011_GWE1_38_10]|uniref:Glycyl-tRNA synthetase n=1 Tax=Candidatus Shapirobacteria bacterium GW2011_GWE1_38_10 TaxID=1618488 RepID=A0A0G0LBM8_9BACT|nr:MAG: Glycyl-tRNA synthetase [Candidatus Shapirobacteria bacterium GW2011_GWF2_37_20]KKQ50081.1 MAG: Glycyl-tRNA synthetase [Candidatus Shapirobacteria bacterium GW2011_GWE1_38_10]KKQ65270.1 MAG: Glycyl-tRNA synthetase [Candidatus Shapirobacteria bacterium GW2011_GWF1_38_23]
MSNDQNDQVAKIVSLCKRRGIIFQNSEIYGGIQGFYDYGPIGSLIKNNWKSLWLKNNVQQRPDMVLIDGSIITHPKVWEASGHVKNFADTMVECKSCHKRFRPDLLKDSSKCPECGGKFTKGRKYNILFETDIGVIEGEKTHTYLRGEACQTIYLDFQNIVNSSRVKIPFGVAQIGKAFRNEITPKNFLYRTREFEQWDIQFFTKEAEMDKWYEYWKTERMAWYQSLFNQKDSLQFRQHKKDELAFYAKKAFDIEYQTPWGWAEMEGIHWRGDYDLKQHSEFSHEDLSYNDPLTHEKYLPHIVECSGGVDRSLFFLLLDAYQEQKLDNGETRTYLKINPKVSAYKLAIFPLASNKPELVTAANKLFTHLSSKYSVDFDDSSNIGKKYRRQDEIGTPWCAVVDYQTLEDNTVTIRDRDTMSQVRVKIDEIDTWLQKKLN